VTDELAKLGRQQRREVSTQDVTEETVDLDARITSQRARVESARRLLARAQSISDLVSLENELARREADLASLEAKKRRLADLSALSTITVSLVGPDAPAVEDEEPATGFVAGLRGGWTVFLASMTILLTVLGALLPWLVAFGVPLGLLWWSLRRRRHRGRSGRCRAVPGDGLGTAPARAGRTAGTGSYRTAASARSAVCTMSRTPAGIARSSTSNEARCRSTFGPERPTPSRASAPGTYSRYQEKSSPPMLCGVSAIPSGPSAAEVAAVST
jgi:hypothetical protein